MRNATAALKKLLDSKTFLHMPAVYDALGGLIAQKAGFEVAYCGGYVTGGSRAISEPLLTMTEQIRVAEEIASHLDIPVVVDAGAGFGEPLHTMRTVREFVRAGIAGVHIEDQLFPKRAHYHKYQVHGIPLEEFVTKIRYACQARDEVDPDFTIIARTDVCRELGLDIAAERLNAVADSGANLGLLFPRTPEETERAPQVIELPLVYVMSRGNRDGRPIFSRDELKDMGYVAIIDAQASILPTFDILTKAFREMRESGTFTQMTDKEQWDARQAIEDIIGLDGYYEIEAATVEK